MKEKIKSHLHALKVYNPYQVFVVYFTPVFSVLFLGYYFNSSVIREIFSLSQSFSIFTKFVVVLIICTFLGKILSDLSAYIIAGIRLTLYWLGLILFKATKWLKRFLWIKASRKALQSALTEGHPHHNEFHLQAALKSNSQLENWYSRIYIATTSLQTLFGALLVLVFFYPEGPTFLMYSIVLIVLILNFSSQKHLMHAEDVVSKHSK